MVIVQTKEELKAAVEVKAGAILVKGQLAKQLYDGKNIVKMGRATLIILGLAVAAIPFTGGGSMALGAGKIATLTGQEIGLISAVIFVGLTLLLAVYKNYDIEIKRRKDREVDEIVVIFRRRNA